MRSSSLFLGLLLTVALAAPSYGHHAITAEFDSNKQITLNGKVNNVDWMNPHSYIFVDVKDQNLGSTRTWACELPSPSELARRGFTRGSLKVGMEVHLVGTRAKDGSYKIHTDILTADNSVLFSK